MSRSAPAQRTGETARHDVLTKKMKVDVDLTEGVDDFENDLDDEMMMIAQSTEEEICIRSSSSRKTADNWRQLQTNTGRNVLSTGAAFMSSCHEGSAMDNRRHILETGSRTASDPGVSRCSTSYDSAGSSQSNYANKLGFSNTMDMKHCMTDTCVKDMKHNIVAKHNSADNHVSCSSSTPAVAMYSTPPGSV